MDSEDSVVSRRGFLRVAAGAGAASGVVGTAAAQEETPTATPGGNETATSGGNQTATATESSSGGGGSEEVIVGPGGNLVFEPEELQITPGTTVTWVWDSDGHNVVADSQPEGTNWEGTEGGASQLYDSGHEYSHTFETLGTYEYVCTPHASAGMVGSIEVVESISTPEPAAGPPEIPDSAKTLGIAATIGMASTLGLAYFLMRFGGDYEGGE